MDSPRRSGHRQRALTGPEAFRLAEAIRAVPLATIGEELG
jgi:hypothetical protein